MRHIGLVLLLVLLSATALGEGATVTYRDYGGKLTVSADS